MAPLRNKSMNKQAATDPQPPSKMPSPMTPAKLRASRGSGRLSMAPLDDQATARQSGAHDGKENAFDTSLLSRRSTVHGSVRGSEAFTGILEDFQDEGLTDSSPLEAADVPDEADGAAAGSSAASPAKSTDKSRDGGAAALEDELWKNTGEQEALAALSEELRNVLSSGSLAASVEPEQEEESASELFSQKASVEGELKTSQEKNIQLSTRLESLVSENKDLSEALEEERVTSATLREEIAAVSLSRAIALAQVQSTREECDLTLQEQGLEVQRLVERLSDWQCEAARLQAALGESQEAAAKGEARTEALAGAVRDTQAALRAFRDQVEGMRGQIEDRDDTLRERDASILDCNATILSLQTTTATLKTSLASRDASLASSVRGLEEAIGAARAESEERDASLASMAQEEIGSLYLQLEAAVDQIEGAKAAVAHAEDARRAAEEAWGRTAQHITQVEAQVTLLDTLLIAAGVAAVQGTLERAGDTLLLETSLRDARAEAVDAEEGRAIASEAHAVEMRRVLELSHQERASLLSQCSEIEARLLDALDLRNRDRDIHLAAVEVVQVKLSAAEGDLVALRSISAALQNTEQQFELTREQIDVHKKALATGKAERKALRAQNDELRRMLDEAKKLLAQGGVDGQIARLEDAVALKEAQDRVLRRDEKIVQKNKRIVLLEKEKQESLKALEQVEGQMTNGLEAMTTVMHERGAEVASLTIEVADLKSALAVARASCSDLENGTHAAGLSEMAATLHLKEREAGEAAAAHALLSGKFAEGSNRLEESSAAILAVLHYADGEDEMEGGSPSSKVAGVSKVATTPNIPAACALIKTRMVALNARVESLSSKVDEDQQASANIAGSRDEALQTIQDLSSQLQAKRGLLARHQELLSEHQGLSEEHATLLEASDALTARAAQAEATSKEIHAELLELRDAAACQVAGVREEMGTREAELLAHLTLLQEREGEMQTRALQTEAREAELIEQMAQVPDELVATLHQVCGALVDLRAAALDREAGLREELQDSDARADHSEAALLEAEETSAALEERLCNALQWRRQADEEISEQSQQLASTREELRGAFDGQAHTDRQLAAVLLALDVTPGATPSKGISKAEKVLGELGEAREALRESEASLEELKFSLSSVNTVLEGKKDALQALDQKERAASGENNRLQMQLIGMQDRVAAMQATIQAAEHRSQVSRATGQTLQQNKGNLVARSDSQIQALETQLLHAETEKLRNQKEVERTRGMVVELSKLLDEEHTRVWDSQVSMEGCEDEITDLKQNLADLKALYMTACEQLLQKEDSQVATAALELTSAAYNCSSTPQEINLGSNVKGSNSTKDGELLRAKSKIDWEKVVSSGQHTILRLTEENKMLEQAVSVLRGEIKEEVERRTELLEQLEHLEGELSTERSINAQAQSVMVDEMVVERTRLLENLDAMQNGSKGAHAAPDAQASAGRGAPAPSLRAGSPPTWTKSDSEPLDDEDELAHKAGLGEWARMSELSQLSPALSAVDCVPSTTAPARQLSPVLSVDGLGSARGGVDLFSDAPPPPRHRQDAAGLNASRSGRSGPNDPSNFGLLPTPGLARLRHSAVESSPGDLSMGSAYEQGGLFESAAVFFARQAEKAAKESPSEFPAGASPPTPYPPLDDTSSDADEMAAADLRAANMSMASAHGRMGDSTSESPAVAILGQMKRFMF